MIAKLLLLWLFCASSHIVIKSAAFTRRLSPQQHSSAAHGIETSPNVLLRDIHIEAQDTYYGSGQSFFIATSILDPSPFNQHQSYGDAKLNPTGTILTIRMLLADLIKYKWYLIIGRGHSEETFLYTLDFDDAMSDHRCPKEVSRIGLLDSLDDWHERIDRNEAEAIQEYQEAISRRHLVDTQENRRLLHVPFYLEREMHKRYAQHDEKFDLPSDDEHVFVIRWQDLGIEIDLKSTYTRLERFNRPGISSEGQPSLDVTQTPDYTRYSRQNGWIMTSDLGS